MRIDFEKVLADYGLKVGDKVNVDKSLYNPYTINYIEFRGFYLISSINTFMEIQVLGISEWEKVEPKKKVGDLLCSYGLHSGKCPLSCLNCICTGGLSTLSETWSKMLQKHPQLEPMREYIEAELNKEVNE